MVYISVKLQRLIRNRANNCCEYCRLYEDDSFFSHEIDHIISKKHRGTDDEDNLCLSCFNCNRFKGSDIGSIDVETDKFAYLFNPRTMLWDDHFELDNGSITPLTPIGRVSAFLLRFNSENRIDKRKELIPLKRYPCYISDD